MPRSPQTDLATKLIELLDGTSRAHRLGLTLLASGALLVLFGLYSFAIGPLVKPSHKARQAERGKTEESPAPETDRTIEFARRHLPHAPWTVEPLGTQVETVDGNFLYWKEWTPKENEKVIEFKPFAMIWRPKNAKPSDEPYTIVSEAAYVTFEKKFSFPTGNPGKIVQAGLDGAVLVQGPEKLRVWGRDFAFNREAMRIYSDRHLRFELDQHKGEAEGVQVELIADGKAKADEALAISGISSLKLLKHVHLSLIADASSQPVLAGKQRKAKKQSQPVDVRSEGSLNFELASRVATLERNVVVLREMEPGKFDGLSSDESVEITFVEKSPEKKPKASGEATAKPDKSAKPEKPDVKGGSAISSRMGFKSLHAWGKDVRLRSDANELRAKMEDLRYDSTTREVQLVSPTRVVVSQKTSTLRSPSIKLLHDDEGELTHLWCHGAGKMEHVNEKTKELELLAEWRKEMRKYPDPKSAFDLIDMDEALIEQPKDESGIAADHVRIWMQPQRRKKRATAKPNRPATSSPAKSPSIDHMLAWQNVAMVSPQLDAETERLEIWFEAAAPAAAGASRPSRARLVPVSQKTSGGSASPRPIYLAAKEQAASASSAPAKVFAKQPAADGGQPAKKPGEEQRDEPFHMTAAVIKVRVVQPPEGKAEVAEVLSNGNVRLQQVHPDGEEPLVIEGTELHIQNRGPLDQDMTIVGQPAHVRNRGAHVEGTRILFNRAKNTADVVSPGKMRLPVKQSADGKQLAQALPLQVEFQEKMKFDGRTAKFSGLVRAKFQNGESNVDIHCRDLSVILQDHFSFAKERPSASPQIETIVCDGGVEFESTTAAGEKVTEIRKGQFVTFTLHQVTGKTDAVGPGEMRMWRFSEHGNSSFTQMAGAESNTPSKKRKESVWEYFQISFAGRMEGDFSQAKGAASTGAKPAAGSSPLGGMEAWSSTFHDSVQVLFGSVDRPLETVSRDKLDQGSGWLGCRTLEVVQHPQTKEQDRYSTMLARGHGAIEGATYRGEADVISFDGSKNQYMLHGEGDHKAQLWRQQQPGAPTNQSTSRRIMYNPKTGELKLEKVSGIDGGQ